MSTAQFIPERMVAEVEYLGLGPATDTGGNTVTKDFSDVDFGPEEQGKVVALACRWVTPGTSAPSRAMVSATINGEVAQIDLQLFENVPFARAYVAIISAAVDAASGPVSLTFEGDVPATGCEFHIYPMVGLVEYPTLVAVDSDQVDSDTDVSLFVQTKAGGIVIFATSARNAATEFTLTGVTEDYDIANFDNRYAGGHYESATDEAAHEIRSQNAQTNGALLAVSYR